MKISLDNSKQIIDAYMPLIIANARKFSAFEYEEAVDQSKILLIEAILEYDEQKGTFGNFLKKKLYYYFLDEAKKINSSSLDDFDRDGNPLIESLEDNYDFEMDFLANEDNKILYQKINQLPNDLKTIIYNKFFLDMTNKEIGEIMNLSSKTVANKSSMALKILKENLGKQDIENNS